MIFLPRTPIPMSKLLMPKYEASHAQNLVYELAERFNEPRLERRFSCMRVQFAIIYAEWIFVRLAEHHVSNRRSEM